MKTAYIVPLCILSLFLLSSYTLANPNAGGVSVQNVSPEITFIHFSSLNDSTVVNITVSDYNSWRDIYSITVEIIGDDGPICVVNYTQHTTRSNWTISDHFNETIGNYFIPSESRVQRSSGNETVKDLCEMQILFTFEPIRARSLIVTVEDRSGMTALARADYPSPLATVPERLPIPTDIISITLAIIGTIVGIKLKYDSFKRPIKDLRNGVRKK